MTYKNEQVKKNRSVHELGHHLVSVKCDQSKEFDHGTHREMAMAISEITYNWFSLWDYSDYTSYKWGDLLVLTTGITQAITAS